MAPPPGLVPAACRGPYAPPGWGWPHTQDPDVSGTWRVPSPATEVGLMLGEPQGRINWTCAKHEAPPGDHAGKGTQPGPCWWCGTSLWGLAPPSLPHPGPTPSLLQPCGPAAVTLGHRACRRLLNQSGRTCVHPSCPSLGPGCPFTWLACLPTAHSRLKCQPQPLPKCASTPITTKASLLLALSPWTRPTVPAGLGLPLG